MRLDWKYVKIGDVCTVERGGSPRPIDQYITNSPDGINWIKIGDTSDSMYITATEQKIIPEGMKKSRYVKPGDFLLSNSMSFGRPYILKIDGCIHDGWLVIRDDNNLYDKRFLYYYLSAPTTYEKFKGMAVGGVVNNLNSDMVRGVSIPLPIKNEQCEIADTLDKVTTLLSLRKQQLAKLDELVKARFVELFDEKYETRPLGSVCEELFAGGDVKKEISSDIQSEEHPYPIYTNGEKNNGLYGYTSIARVTKEAITISGRGTIGFTCLRKEPFYPAVRLIVAVPNQELVSGCYLQHFVQSKNYGGQGASIPQLTVPMVKDELIPVPPMELQNQFAAFVEQTDKSKLEIQKSLEKLETLKKALMQKYFG